MKGSIKLWVQSAGFLLELFTMVNSTD